jgi:O-antigen/teichoic acid export membrane protein
MRHIKTYPGSFIRTGNTDRKWMIKRPTLRAEPFMNTKYQTESQKFISDVVWLGVSQVLMNLTGLAILPALTKSYPAQIYGLWSQMVVTIGLLGIILTIKFDSAIVRFLAAEEDRDKRRYAFGTMLWPILALICLVLALSLLLGRNLSILLFNDTQYAYFVPLAFLWASIESLFLFSLSYLRARGKIKRLSIIRLGLSIARMLLIVLLALAGCSFYWLVGGVIAVEALFVAVVFAIIVWEIGLPKFSLIKLKNYIGYSAPMLSGDVLYWVVSASDRYFITHFLNISQTGIYSASYALANMIGLLSWPIGMVLFPAISRLWEQGELPKVKIYFQYSMKLFLALAVPAAGGLYILSKPLLGILTTSEFIVAGALVLLLAISGIFSGILLINEYLVYLQKRTGWLPLIYTIGAITNVVVNIVLIPKIGILGAAVSTVIANFVLSMIFTFWGRKIIDYKLDFKFFSKVVAATTVMTGCLWLIKVDGAVGIITLVVIGAVIYGLGLFLLRAFSKEDRILIKETLSGLIIRFRPGQERV